MSQHTVVVTGDIILDCNLYGGMKTAATSFSEPGTRLHQELGGAALTHGLISIAADVEGLAWDDRVAEWNAADARRERERKAALSWPEGLPAERPSPSYAVHLDLVTRGLENSLPAHLRSYHVWTRNPVSRDESKRHVWRSGGPFGYGSTEPARQKGVFVRNPDLPEGGVALTVIDDQAILFRQGASAEAWPRIDANGGWYLLNMGWPLCRGDLWAALAPVASRLIVVVSAADLRREDVQVNSHLSWEQCAEQTIHALRTDSVVRDLMRAAHVIVNFESEGALWCDCGSRDRLPAWRLLFDHERLEGDHASAIEGQTYGQQSALVAALAHALMVSHTASPAAGPFTNAAAMCKAIETGVLAGVAARRLFLELGHGPIDAPKPGTPLRAVGRYVNEATAKPGGLETIGIPEDVVRKTACNWTILGQTEGASESDGASQPLTGLGLLTALHGTSALSHVPALRMGGLYTVDRTEIESLRILEGLIRRYEAVKVQPKPLSIGVFGPPGAGKSFAVKALARAILGDKVPFLEFNLSQFEGPDELIGSFHEVRDCVLEGATPAVFWDEFDSQQFRWLQYLLAPMQDGAFQEGQITHPIGKCVFIFAGGTSPCIEDFGVAGPRALDERVLAELTSEERADFRRRHAEHVERRRQFVLLKGPDFISRLHGFLNVLGPNPRTDCACSDITWPIRRALILRGILRLKDGEYLHTDLGLLNALLGVPVYEHGARSFEKVVTSVGQGRAFGRLTRSGLPPRPLLARETDPNAFASLMEAGDAFKRHQDVEAIAAAVHNSFLSAAEKSKLEAVVKGEPALAWRIHPAILKAYEDLEADGKASNRAAARRIPEHLALIGFVTEPQEKGDTKEWQAPLVAAIEKHVDRIAQAEHLGWCAERRANGWSYAAQRNNPMKHHPLLVDWSRLSQTDKDKDRSSARSIPGILEVAGFKAVPVKAATRD
jgi:hypothetical protein